MTFEIAALLTQDGLTTGAIYVLLAVAIVMVFTVTRIILVPQGDFVAFSALTLAAFETGTLPGTVWIIALLAAIAVAFEISAAVTGHDVVRGLRGLTIFGLVPVTLCAVAAFAVPKESALVWKMTVTCGLISALGPLTYRVAFQPIAAASPLVLLIAAIAVHFGLTSLGLHFFGAEGVRTSGFGGPALMVADLQVPRQSIGVLATSVVLMGALYLFFSRTLSGKALLASAYNRRGAQIVGISVESAGRKTFTVTALIGAVSGILIGPMTTLYYDSGFLLGLKGFVGAIIGALAIYPLAAAGAVLVGLFEAFASFWASAYRDALVFTLILPVLLWRSLAHPHAGDEGE